MQRTRCPHCQKKLKYEEGLEGGTYRCPKCGHGVTLGTPADVSRGTHRKVRRSATAALRALAWPVAGLIMLGCAVLVVRWFQEGAKQRERDAHPILVR